MKKMNSISIIINNIGAVYDGKKNTAQHSITIRRLHGSRKKIGDRVGEAIGLNMRRNAGCPR